MGKFGQYHTIAISGDSWGCGEWHSTNHGHIVVHSGLEKYLRLAQHRVVNTSAGGVSNNYSIDQFEFLNFSQIDIVIWFQTDPLRDLKIQSTSDFRYHFKNFDELLCTQSNLLEQAYSRLNKFNHKILCIGGCSKLDLNLISNFENLIPFIPSIPEFILPNYKHPEIWSSGWINHIDHSFDIDNLDRLLYNKKIQDSLIEYKEWFWPDGCHANRKAHKLIFDYLIEHENLS